MGTAPVDPGQKSGMQDFYAHPQKGWEWERRPLEKAGKLRDSILQ